MESYERKMESMGQYADGFIQIHKEIELLSDEEKLQGSVAFPVYEKALDLLAEFKENLGIVLSLDVKNVHFKKYVKKVDNLLPLRDTVKVFAKRYKENPNDDIAENILKTQNLHEELLKFTKEFPEFLQRNF